MSYFENIHAPKIDLQTLGMHAPKIALETLGLRRDERQMADLVMPVLGAFALGLGLGAGIALLLAPQSGRELREDLRTQAGKLEQNVRTAIPQMREAMEDGRADDHVYETIPRSTTS